MPGLATFTGAPRRGRCGGSAVLRFEVFGDVFAPRLRLPLHVPRVQLVEDGRGGRSITKFSREDVTVFQSFQSFLDCSTPATTVLDFLGTVLSYERLLFTGFRKREAPF